MGKKDKALAKKKKSEVDLASVADGTVKVSVDPEKAGEFVGELMKKAAKKAVETVLRRD